MSPLMNQGRVQRAPGRRLPALDLPLFFALSLAALLCATPDFAAPPLPVGGHFVGGSGSITQTGADLSITQAGARGIIEWNSFSIGAGHTVSIDNGTGATLNRVTGTDLSAIRGMLTGTGDVYLINPHGVLIGRRGVVSTGGTFVASTLDVPNDTFLNPPSIGGTGFTGTSTGSIVNLGKIDSSGKDVFLISDNKVTNAGTISAPNGNAELSVGHEVVAYQGNSAEYPETLVFVGSGGTVMNTGTVEAALINLAAADGNIYALAGHSGALRANGTATRNGEVWLIADGGLSGTPGNIDARGARISARSVDSSGGIVSMTGHNVDVGGAEVQTKTWTLNTADFTADAATARTLGGSLDRGTSINVSALGSDGTNGANGEGDIAIDSSVRWRGDATLKLQASHSVSVAPGVTIANKGAGSLVLFADVYAHDKGGSVTNLGTLDWSRSTGTVAMYYDMNGNYTPGTLRANPCWQAAPLTGLVTQITAYQLVNNVADLTAVNNNLNGIYALGYASIDFTNAPEFVGIGSAATPFNGQFDGRNQAGVLYLSVSGTDDTGLFRVVGPNGVVRNVGIGPATVSASGGAVGVLVGTNYGHLVNDIALGNITLTGGADTMAGGLAGQNFGRIELSEGTAIVNGTGMIGGLVGRNNGSIDQSFAYNFVNAGAQSTAGGLVGTNNGSISRSYAWGGVTGATTLGGLVGNNTGEISQSYSKVTLTPGVGAATGGIAGNNSGTIAGDVFWNSESSTAAAGVGTGTPVAGSSGLTDQQLGMPASFGPTWDFSPTGVWNATSSGPTLRYLGLE